jgi:hypothetical protein
MGFRTDGQDPIAGGGRRWSGRSVAEAAESYCQFAVVGSLYDALSAGESVLNVAVLGPMASMANHRFAADQVIVAIGYNEVREKLVQQLAATGFALATVNHSRAIVSASAVWSGGSAVMVGVFVGAKARLGVGSIVNCGAVVDHHVTIEDFGHLGVNARMAGGTVLGRGAWMQGGAALGYGMKVPLGVTRAPGEAMESKTNKYKND